MSIEENKEIVKGFITRLFSTRDLGLLEEAMPSDVVAHAMPSGLPMGDRAGVRETLQQLLTAFPDLRIQVLDLIAENNKVVVRGVLSGTQAAPFREIPPMGKHFSVPTIQIMELRDGKIVEHWFESDSLSMVEQLGGHVTI